jgi:hypothetical protein
VLKCIDEAERSGDALLADVVVGAYCSQYLEVCWKFGNPPNIYNGFFSCMGGKQSVIVVLSSVSSISDGAVIWIRVKEAFPSFVLAPFDIYSIL